MVSAKVLSGPGVSRWWCESETEWSRGCRARTCHHRYGIVFGSELSILDLMFHHVLGAIPWLGALETFHDGSRALSIVGLRLQQTLGVQLPG